jgi:hypothetical protein
MTTCEAPLFGCCGLPVGGRWVVKHTVTRLATAVILLLLATPLSATAQPTGKVYRIGFIPTGAPNEAEHLITIRTRALSRIQVGVSAQHRMQPTPLRWRFAARMMLGVRLGEGWREAVKSRTALFEREWNKPSRYRTEA